MNVVIWNACRPISDATVNEGSILTGRHCTQLDNGSGVSPFAAEMHDFTHFRNMFVIPDLEINIPWCLELR